MTVIVKHDKSPVADLKRPYNTRHRVDSQASGAIELAYLRGYQAGLEDAMTNRLEPGERNPDRLIRADRSR